MTRQEDTPPQIYVPALRRELVPRALPDAVRFMDPGLPQTASAPGFFHPQKYPFSRERAADVLAELLAVGETLDAANAAAHRIARSAATDDAMAARGEKAAFAPPPANGPRVPAPGDDPRIAAQKVLLLAWDLETRLLEIASLHREVAEAVKPLAKNLHGNEAASRKLAAILPDALFESVADLPESMKPDWRLSLMAIAAFAPRNALFVTCHAGMRNALAEVGKLAPLPEDTARRAGIREKSPQTRPLWGKTPLWRLLGHSREPENAPWLLAAPEIIVWPA